MMICAGAGGSSGSWQTVTLMLFLRAGCMERRSGAPGVGRRHAKPRALLMWRARGWMGGAADSRGARRLGRQGKEENKGGGTRVHARTESESTTPTTGMFCAVASWCRSVASSSTIQSGGLAMASMPLKSSERCTSD